MFEALLWQQWIAAIAGVLAGIVALAAWMWPRGDAAGPAAHRLAERHPPGQWAMTLLIVTEAALFACLIFSWVYLKQGSKTWAAHVPPELRIPGINTVVLLASSAVLHWGVKRGDRWMRAAIAATIALGVVFVTLQGWEYAHQDFGPATDAYGSAFVIITGIHGVHVVVGLLMLEFALLALRRESNDRGGARAGTIARYWHFVDVVWVTVFAVLYVAPHIWR